MLARLLTMSDLFYYSSIGQILYTLFVLTMARLKRRCAHNNVYTGCSPAAEEAGFLQPPIEKRLAAATPPGRRTAEKMATHPDEMQNEWSFPAPLVLPNDDLALDPKYPPQSLKSWLTYNRKMPIKLPRNKIYVVQPPEVTSSVKAMMDGWETPRVPKEFATPDLPAGITSPSTDDLCNYLRSFYHKMVVEKHEGKFRWQAWGSGSKKNPKYIGLATPKPSEELIGVRFRPAPDGIARMQVNLNDVLDALIDRVPPDAYAIVMLTDLDIYEDEDDDFCCGRAYGESRIAVVSSFRYNPKLDVYSDIQLGHMWPTSHCESYVDELCGADKHQCKRAKVSSSLPDSPLVAAIAACNVVPIPKTRDELAGMWFSRVARTMAHELGHCLGLDHCVYYACAMQGSAGMAEDMRQPPYLCPVCLSKISWALCSFVGPGVFVNLQRDYIEQRYNALRTFCENWKHVGMFAGYQAWIDGRIEEKKKNPWD
ncbi:hypothetical protein EDB81DRAFT_93294 [Dactylonectria macrodidyma]|uniref:Archaemetzincin-2 n=1 Tax=Dactylonectria macrodidyma TaxID=307937 RepID=A0A9P9IVV3_9HYPO|nr:hypothetical protein EDB81DRAFT_93294 [Dactylonectria macrodidyma]